MKEDYENCPVNEWNGDTARLGLLTGGVLDSVVKRGNGAPEAKLLGTAGDPADAGKAPKSDPTGDAPVAM